MLMVVMIRKRVSIPTFLLLLAGLLVGGALFTNGAAQAITYYGPDKAEFGGSNSAARYALEDTTNVEGANNVTFPVYYLNEGPVPEDTTSFKPPADMIIKFNGFKTFGVGKKAGAGLQVKVAGSTKWNTVVNNGTQKISKAEFTYSADINGWKSSYQVKMTSSGIQKLQFRANITQPAAVPIAKIAKRGSIGKIGYDADNGSKVAIAAQGRCDPGKGSDTSGCGKYFDYVLPFGTACSQAGTKSVSTKIYDNDNDSVGDLRDKNGTLITEAKYRIQGSKAFSAKLFDVTDGTEVDLKIPRSGKTGNGEDYTYSFTAEPRHKYEFRISNVYSNNVIQFKLPYDSIESITDCNYDVTPTVSINPDVSEASVGSLSGVYYTTNSRNGATDSSAWQLTRCVVSRNLPAAAHSKAADNTSNGTQTYRALGATCQQQTSGTTSFKTGGPHRIGTFDEPMPALLAGDRVCYIFSINRYANNSGDDAWRHGIDCTLIAKKPKVQILGSDLFVGRLFSDATGAIPNSKIQASITKKDSIYGSWVEYLGSATGSITNLGTGSGYANGAAADQTACAVGKLTLSNSLTSGTCQESAMGKYNTNQTIPNVMGSFATAATTPTLPASTALSGLNGLYKAPNALTITGGAIPAGRSVIINAPNSDVTINGDITYASGPYANADQIPQVVIIAKTISIRGANSANAVKNIDAWLIATSSINTCSDVAAGALTTTLCATQLVVNGPVMTNKLFLWRTAGAQTGSDEVAGEVFNLRADVYLWALAQAAKSGRLQTATETELPPRF